MITIKVNKQDIEIPTSWSDIKFSEYETIAKLEGIELIAYFLKMSKEELEQYTHIKNFELINQVLKFILIAPEPQPVKTIKFNGKIYDAELEVLDMCIGQYKDAISLATDEVDNNKVKLIVATYLQPTLDNSKYDSSRVDKLADEIANQLSVQDFIDIQGFFLQRLIKSRSGIRKTSTLLSTIKKRILLVFLNWKYMVLG